MGKTYCSLTNCTQLDCPRHQSSAPPGSIISIANLNDGYCYIPDIVNQGDENERSRLLLAICRGTQKTNYECDEVCKAMCGSVGDCHYCATIADAIIEEFRK
jgi:hypothetical protein